MDLVVVAGAAGPDPLVRDMGFCLLVAGLMTVLCARLRIPSIAAYLATGVILGPQLGALVTDQKNIETISSLGLVLLLFLIGLELDLRTLLKSGRVIVAAGILIFARVATARMKEVPDGAQNFWEWMVESLHDFLESIIGSQLARRTFWFFASVFIFILFANWA